MLNLTDLDEFMSLDMGEERNVKGSIHLVMLSEGLGHNPGLEDCYRSKECVS